MQHGGARIIGVAASAAVATLTAAGLGACGNDDDNDAAASDADLTVVAEDDLTFDADSYTAPAGEVTVVYEDGGSIAHTLLIEGVDNFKLSVTSDGDTDVGTVQLDPGDYRTYCDVPGHGDMEATLTVE